MRTTRRSLLTMLGLGAVAVALAPAAVQAETTQDAIAQARADGYNRGREVEMARGGGLANA